MVRSLTYEQWKKLTPELQEEYDYRFGKVNIYFPVMGGISVPILGLVGLILVSYLAIKDPAMVAYKYQVAGYMQLASIMVVATYIIVVFCVIEWLIMFSWQAYKEWAWKRKYLPRSV